MRVKQASSVKRTYFKKIHLLLFASGTDVQAVHDGGSRSGADLALSENGTDADCSWNHVIHRPDYPILSHVLHLGCLHEDCHRSTAGRHSQLHHVINYLGRLKPLPFSLKLSCSHSRRCIFANMRCPGKYQLRKHSWCNLATPLIAVGHSVCLMHICHFFNWQTNHCVYAMWPMSRRELIRNLQNSQCCMI